MKRINFLTNAMIPGALSMVQWDQNVKDIVLTNSLATETGISEMNLHVEGFAAISTDDVEHSIMDFPGQRALKIQSLATGRNLRTRSMVKLPSGKYKKLRFYVAPYGNSFTYQDKRQAPVFKYDFLDFDIEDGLELRGVDSSEFILRFDFPPYTSPGIFKSLISNVKSSLMSKKRTQPVGA